MFDTSKTMYVSPISHWLRPSVDIRPKAVYKYPIKQNVRKGTQLYIEGKIRTRSWEDQNKIRRYTTEIYVDNMELLGRRDGQSSPSSAPVMSQSQNNSSPANTSYNSPIENSSDDDLPF